MAVSGTYPGMIVGVPGSANERFRHPAAPQRVAAVAEALKANGMTVFVEPTPEAARDRVRALVPEGVEVFTAASRTLEDAGILELLDRSGKYHSIRAAQAGMDRKTQGREMVKMGASPEFVLGSVHAITEQGQALIASASGSQLGPYSAGAAKVIWVVGSQKIVRDLEEGITRIRECSFPLEDERAKKAYGFGSSISKLLLFQKEFQPGRVTVILVNGVLGF